MTGDIIIFGAYFLPIAEFFAAARGRFALENRSLILKGAQLFVLH